MNEELILKKRSDGIKLLIESNLEDLESLSEIIASEVIRFKPDSDSECYWFIYRILESMIKTENIMAAYTTTAGKDQLLEDLEKYSLKMPARPEIVEYYMKESLGNYFRSDTKMPLAQATGCTSCVDVGPDEGENKIKAIGGIHRCKTTDDLMSATHTTLEHHPWESRQSWHSLQYPENLIAISNRANQQETQETEKGSQVSSDELATTFNAGLSANEDILLLDEASGGADEEVPSAPPSSPRVDNQLIEIRSK